MPLKTNINIISCRSGGTLLLVALMLPVLLVAMGVALDIGRIYAVKGKAQNAADAALLGAVSSSDTTPVGDEMVRLFNANYPANYMGSTVGTIAVSQPSAGVYQVNFSITVPTTIMSLFGTSVTTVNTLSQVTSGYMTETNPSLELALVLDNTGSMNQSLGGSITKMQGLKTAATDLTNILFGTATTLNNLHISIVPYDVDVNLGSNRSTWVQSAFTTTYNNFHTYAGGSKWYLANRKADITTDTLSDISDAPPTSDATRFRTPYAYGWGAPHNSGYNFDFVNSSLAPMQFALNVQSSVIAAINAMTASGDTRINVGLMWGWFTLSSQWQGVWSSGLPDLPATPNPSLLQKVLILMTDGENTVYCPDSGCINGGVGNASNDDTTTANLCDAIKASPDGITIYTIGYGTTGTVNIPLLQGCASSPSDFFLAPTEADLQNVFHAIADNIQIPTLRLSQ